MNYEILGTLGSIIILVSFFMNNEKKIRVVNMIGSLFFIIYGLINGLFSVWFLNGALIVVHCCKLYKLNKF